MRESESDGDPEISLTSEMLTSRIEGLLTQNQTKTILQQQLLQWQATENKPKLNAIGGGLSNNDHSNVQKSDNFSDFAAMKQQVFMDNLQVQID